MPKGRLQRLVALFVLGCLIALGWWWFTFTASGQQLIHEPHTFATRAHEWVHHHRFIAPAVVVCLYIVLTVLGLLPVWWLQVIAGFAFGTWMGVFWCDIAAAIGAVAAMLTSRWLAADWFHKRVESRMARLQQIDEKLGHNGFLVVMLVRLSHVAPFGLSNYMFGLLNITPIDVLLGTLLGGLPAIMAVVMEGSDPHAYRKPYFWILLGVTNAVLFIPVLLRYWKPRWFRKFGVE